MSLNTLNARLAYAGGDQNARIRQNKLASFRAALKSDYNSRMIKTAAKEAWPCLINSDKLTSDYDKKFVSVEFDSGLEPGDTFEVLDDGTHWMVYLPFLTETAYLRSQIVRCHYDMEVNGKRYWVYFQGPTETAASWFIKRDVNIAKMNLGGEIYVKRNEDTDEFFQRFRKFRIADRPWQVQATDRHSTPGIIDVLIEETFDDTVAGLPEIREECPIRQIIGPDMVPQDTVVGYEIRGDYILDDGKWWVDGNPRVVLQDVSKDGRFCKVLVHDGAVGDFRVYYGVKESSYNVTVHIKTCKPVISGPTVIAPFDVVEYEVPEDAGPGSFLTQTKDAHVVSQDGRRCKVEVTSSRKCEFDLFFNGDDGRTRSIAITVHSL